MAGCTVPDVATVSVMILAELKVWHTRPVTPTRRVALGDSVLPMDPAPGLGGLLLAAVVAVTAEGLDDDLRPGLWELMASLERGERVPQPRLRHRFQQDRVGLTSTTHRLVGHGHRDLAFELEPIATPEPHLLAALYRAGLEPPLVRRSIFTLLRSATNWRGGNGPDLVAYLTGRAPDLPWARAADLDPLNWALDVLEITDESFDRRMVQRQFRRLLRVAHPDHGGEELGAGVRIRDLAAARRILLDRRGA